MCPEDEETRRWGEYWNSLSKEERQAELDMMGAHEGNSC